MACGTFTRLCQPQQDHARALSSAQHLQEGSQPTQEQDLVTLAGLQFHLVGHGGDLPLPGLQNHGDPGWVFGLHLWWWHPTFAGTMVVLGWFSGAVLKNRLGLSSARCWETPGPQ